MEVASGSMVTIPGAGAAPIAHARRSRSRLTAIYALVDLDPRKEEAAGRFCCPGPGDGQLDGVASSNLSKYTILYVHWRCGMKTMTYSESRARYAETLNAVTDDREEVVITRAGHDPVVMVALDDYESLKETAYLLKSPENARRLLASIDRLEHGDGVVHDLAE